MTSLSSAASEHATCAGRRASSRRAVSWKPRVVRLLRPPMVIAPVTSVLVGAAVIACGSTGPLESALGALAFRAPPSTTTAGAPITPAVQVVVRDANGAAVTSFTDKVAVKIGTNPGGGTLSGVDTVTAVAGVATFSNLSINKAGTGYTLVASAPSAPSLGTATSTPFNINPGLAALVAFLDQSANVDVGEAILREVAVVDNFGNTCTSCTDNVTVAIGANPGGGTLSGTTTVGAVAGVATFANLHIDKPGNGYTLSASSGSLTPGTSTPFNVNPKLSITVQPSTTTAGAAIAPAVQVTAQDAQGNTATSFTGSISVAIGTNPAGGTLSGTTTVGAVAGVATFANLHIDKAGTGYTLSALLGPTSPGATSTPFTINPGPATKIGFTVQPSNTAPGAAITPAVQVSALDAFGNTATSFTGSVSMFIGTNPGGGTLSGTTAATAVAGVATFANLHIDKAGTGYTLDAAAGSLGTAPSAPFNIGP